jgi:SAM-dependent methyltransferase
MDSREPVKSYATFGLQRSLRQIRQALDDRRHAGRNMELLMQLVKQSEQRMAAALGRPIENLRILEIGPGQGMERARYFGIKNEVFSLDLDVIPVGTRLNDYVRVWKENGFGRFAKTVGRKLIVARPNEQAWAKAAGVSQMNYPVFMHGDICKTVPVVEAYDMVMSWSVFEHLPDPEVALKNVIRALKPGGLFYISLHLYTSHNGHHDIRAFTGFEDELPLWGHLRPATRHLLQPSSTLNEWRLSQWRELFSCLAPGHTEYLDQYDVKETFGARLTPEIRAELAGYSAEELFSVDAVYDWKKPSIEEDVRHVSESN